MKPKNTSRNALLVLSLVMVATVPLALPYLEAGHQIAHDREVPFMRVIALARALEEPQIPPRWFPDFDGGYGSPYPSFYAMAFYYLAALFYTMGIGVGSAIELTAYLTLVASGLAMYAFIKQLWGRPAGILAAVLYMYAPYHLVDAFVRGAYSELGAFVWFPLLSLSLLASGSKRGTKWILAGAISIAGLVLTHNLMAMLFIPSILIVVFISGVISHLRAKMTFRGLLLRLGATVGLGLLLSAFFWLPIALESGFIRLDYFLQFDFRGDFIGLRNLIGYQGEAGFTTEAGLLLLICSSSTVGLSLLPRKAGAYRIVIIAFFGAGIANLFMTTRFSEWVWQTIPRLEFVQFPWRFLAPASFYLAATAGALSYLTKSRMRAWGIAVGVSLLAIALYSPLASIMQKRTINTIDESQICSEVWGTQDYRPIWSQTVFWRGVSPPASAESGEILMPCPGDVVAQSSANVRVEGLVRRGRNWRFEYDSDEDGSITLSQFYFPGWTATIDDTPAELIPSQPYGLVSLRLPEGTHMVVLSWRETAIRRWGNLLSFAGIGMAIGLAFCRRCENWET